VQKKNSIIYMIISSIYMLSKIYSTFPYKSSRRSYGWICKKEKKLEIFLFAFKMRPMNAHFDGKNSLGMLVIKDMGVFIFWMFMTLHNNFQTKTFSTINLNLQLALLVERREALVSLLTLKLHLQMNVVWEYLQKATSIINFLQGLGCNP